MSIRGRHLVSMAAAVLLFGTGSYADTAGMRLDGALSKRTAFVGETIIVTYTFSAPAKSDAVDYRFLPPAWKHVMVRKRREERPEHVGSREVRRYRFALTPLQSGRIVLAPAAVNVAHRVYRKDAWEQWTPRIEWRQVVSEPLAIDTVRVAADVQSVGNFTIAAVTDTNITAPNEPVTLTLTVSGSGNIDDIVPFSLTIPQVGVFASDPTVRSRIVSWRYEGNLTQIFRLVAEQSFEIPPFVLRFFDPDLRRVREVQTDPVTITVRGSSRENATENKEEAMTGIGWGAVAAAWLIGIVLGAFGVWIAMRRKTASVQIKNDSNRARLIILFRHLDDPEARGYAEALERYLYEGDEAPDEARIDEVIRRLEHPEKK